MFCFLVKSKMQNRVCNYYNLYCIAVLYNTVLYNAVLYNDVLYNAMLYNAVLYNAVLHKTVLYNLHCSTVYQRSTFCN